MKRFLIGIVMLALCGMAAAQQIVVLPVDSNVRIGHLENGLTYYIRHNELPKQRCEFHIAQAVGAILEEDNQDGLAHFLEHMAFNGTEHFPSKGIINYFESIGVNFGGNINAYTSLDETVYRLSDVPTTREGIIDTALLVMHDWACGLSLLPDEIEAERGVIREEWRTRSDANRRMWSAMNPLIFPNSQYAKRDVIGDTAVINNFSYDVLSAYYHKWYGPDNQAIIVVGDIDVDAIEAKIKALWANVPARVNRGERPIYTIDDNEQPLVGIVQDKEAQYSRFTVHFKKDKMPAQLEGTNVAYTISFAHDLIADMLNNRFLDLVVDPNASFIGAASGYEEIVKSKDDFCAIYAAKNGQERKAFEDLVYELEKMRRYGFTQAELDRVWTEVLTNLEKAYNERNNNQNITYTHECIRHFLDHKVMPGISWEYEAAKQLQPMLNLEQINAMAKQLVTTQNLIVEVTAPKNAVIPSEADIRHIIATADSLTIEAPVEEVIRTTLVEITPKVGKIRKVAHNESLGTTEWTLSNGMTVVLKPTNFKQDEVLFSAISLGGTSLIEAIEDLPSANVTTNIIELSGIGDFSYTELKKALTGKYVSMSPSISSSSEALNGSSNVKDMETMFQLAYLYFTAPRRDESAYQMFMSLLSTQIKNRAQNPKVAWGDSITMMRSNNSPRTILMTQDMMDKIDLDKVMRIYGERFANPADFIVTLTGNIDPEDKQLQQMVCTWLGSLKTSKKKEQVKDTGNRVPMGMQQNYFTRPMQTKTASNYIQYTNYTTPYTLHNNLTAVLLGKILDTRYLESIREREGGSYGVACNSRMLHYPIPSVELVMYFDTDPNKQQKLMDIIHEEIQTIADQGPLAIDLSKERESMLKTYEENVEKNAYWNSYILPNYYLYQINYITDYAKTIQAIDGAAIKKMTQTLLTKSNVMEVVMIPQR